MRLRCRWALLVIKMNGPEWLMKVNITSSFGFCPVRMFDSRKRDLILGRELERYVTMPLILIDSR